MKKNVDGPFKSQRQSHRHCQRQMSQPVWAGLDDDDDSVVNHQYWWGGHRQSQSQPVWAGLAADDDAVVNHQYWGGGQQLHYAFDLGHTMGGRIHGESKTVANLCCEELQDKTQPHRVVYSLEETRRPPARQCGEARRLTARLRGASFDSTDSTEHAR